MKKLVLLLLAVAILNLQACGTILKSNQVDKPHSNKLDTKIVVLDSLGLLLFLVPGIVAFTVDYLNGTLYLPGGRSFKLASLDPVSLQKVLADHNVNVSIDQIKKAELQVQK